MRETRLCLPTKTVDDAEIQEAQADTFGIIEQYRLGRFGGAEKTACANGSSSASCCLSSSAAVAAICGRHRPRGAPSAPSLHRTRQPSHGSRRSPTTGRRHLDAGERWRYDSRYPTSGPHQTIWVWPGFYDRRQDPLRLVHALEHGNIVVYFDRQPPDVIDTLQDWAGLFTGQWDGLVVARDPGLGQSIVLTAWRKRLELDRFDAAAAAAFIDAFRGRGPENAVR